MVRELVDELPTTQASLGLSALSCTIVKSVFMPNRAQAAMKIGTQIHAETTDLRRFYQRQSSFSAPSASYFQVSDGETSGSFAAKSQIWGLPVLVVQVLRAILPTIHYCIVCAGSLLPGPFDNVSATLLLRSDFTE